MKRTYKEIASSLSLWNEFFNSDAAMSDAEFEALSIEVKIEMLVAAFGPEHE